MQHVANRRKQSKSFIITNVLLRLVSSHSSYAMAIITNSIGGNQASGSVKDHHQTLLLRARGLEYRKIANGEKHKPRKEEK